MAGFKIVGNHGSTMIDENYKNFNLTATGYVTTPQAGQNVMYDYGQVTYTGSNPLIALRPRGQFSVGATGTYQDGNGVYHTGFITGGSGSLQYYVFDTVPDYTGNTFGVQVRNASGAVTFDSNLRYLRILEIFHSYNDRSVPFTGRTEAAIFCTPDSSVEGGFGGYAYFWNGIYDGGNGLRPGRINLEYTDTSDYGNNNDYNSGYDYPPVTCLVDVTGY